MEDNILIDGVNYDGLLLKAALAFTQGKGEYRLSLEEIQSLYRMAHEGKSATDIKIATLHYIAGHYRLTEKAEKWFSEHFQPVENDSIEATIKKILDEYELFNLRLSIDSDIVNTYLSSVNGRDWESVFRGAIEAYLEGSEGELSLAPVVERMEANFKTHPDHRLLLKSYLDKGTLYLLSADETHDEKMPYDLPEWPDVLPNWTFVSEALILDPSNFLLLSIPKKISSSTGGSFQKKQTLNYG